MRKQSCWRLFALVVRDEANQNVIQLNRNWCREGFPSSDVDSSSFLLIKLSPSALSFHVCHVDTCKAKILRLVIYHRLMDLATISRDPWKTHRDRLTFSHRPTREQNFMNLLSSIRSSLSEMLLTFPTQVNCFNVPCSVGLAKKGKQTVASQNWWLETTINWD